MLELSRLMMLRNHYEGIKRLFPDARLLFTDTDSAMYQVFGQRDPVELLAAANERGDMPCFFDVVNKAKPKDLAGLTPEQRALAFERKGELGAFGWYTSLPASVPTPDSEPRSTACCWTAPTQTRASSVP